MFNEKRSISSENAEAGVSSSKVFDQLTKSEKFGGLKELQGIVAKKLEEPLSPLQQEAVFGDDLDSLRMMRDDLVDKISSVLPKMKEFHEYMGELLRQIDDNVMRMVDEGKSENEARVWVMSFLKENHLFEKFEKLSDNVVAKSLASIIQYMQIFLGSVNVIGYKFDLNLDIKPEDIKSEKLSMSGTTESLKMQTYLNAETGRAAKDKVIGKFKERFTGYNLKGLKGYDEKKANAVDALILERITEFFNIKGEKGAAMEAFIDDLPELTGDFKVDLDELYDDPVFYNYVVEYVIGKHGDYLKSFEGIYFAPVPTVRLLKESKGKNLMSAQVSLEGLLGGFHVSKPKGKFVKHVSKPKGKFGKHVFKPKGKFGKVNIPKIVARPTVNSAFGLFPEGGSSTTVGGSEGGGEGGGMGGGNEEPQVGPKNPGYVKWKLAQLEKAQKIMSGTANEAVSVLMSVRPKSRLKSINYLIRKEENGDYRADSIKAEAYRLYENENNNPDGPDKNEQDKYDAIYSAFNSPSNANIEDDLESGDLSLIGADADTSGFDDGEDYYEGDYVE